LLVRLVVIGLIFNLHFTGLGYAEVVLAAFPCVGNRDRAYDQGDDEQTSKNQAANYVHGLLLRS
jgi:hypothetical protein